MGSVDDPKIVEYMQKCTALIFPGEEDFGIVPLEAQACGKAVIAFGKGGALETVIGINGTCQDRPNPTGIFFYEQTTEALQQSILKFEKSRDRIDPEACRKNALRFDRSNYKIAIQNYIQNKVTSYRDLYYNGLLVRNCW